MSNIELAKSQLEQFASAKDMIQELANNCKNIVIADNNSLEQAKNLAKNAKKIENMIEDKRKEITKPILDEKKQIDDFAKELTSDLNNSIKELRNQILKYEKEQEAIRIAELKRIEDERKAKEAELAKAIQENKEISEVEIQEIEKIREAQQIAVNTPTSKAIRKVWTYEIVAHELVPMEYLMVDERKVKEAIGDGVRDIPGIKIFQKEQLNLR